LAAVVARPAVAGETVIVFAAASLTTLFERLAREAQSGANLALRFSFAASSVLARQIEAGAGADVFASADREWMQHLVRRGFVDPSEVVSAFGNRLALVVPAENTAEIAIGPGFDLAAIVGSGRIAIGDPAHVPAGRYAEAALRQLNLWEYSKPRLARAENVRAALAMVERGEAPVGIVYRSDARLSQRVRIAALFPSETHPAILYPMAIPAGRERAATRAALALLSGSRARELARVYGFEAMA
jgi:molybdate transport system substrate-binding protein